MDDELPVGQIITDENHAIRVELPQLKRPDGEFEFQREWGRRPEGLIPSWIACWRLKHL